MTKNEKKAYEVAHALAEFVNTYSNEPGEFVAKELSGIHRTLQQSVARVVFKWIILEAEAYDAGNYDLRNEMTVKTCKKLRKVLEDEEVVFNSKIVLPTI